MQDFIKKSLRFWGIGLFWVFVLSVPIKGQSLFLYASDALVPYGLVTAIGGQVESTWQKAKTIARNALSDADSEKIRRF